MKRLARCRSGLAALEFALVAPAILMIFAGIADFGLALRDQMQLTQAVSNGATYAFAAQQALASLGLVSSTQVTSIVSASLALSAANITVSQPAPYCIQTNSASSPPTSSLVAGSYDKACPNGNPAGTYMMIKAQYTYQPMMPAYSAMASTLLSASATVRLY